MQKGTVKWFNSADVYEYVWSTSIWLNEAEAFLRVKPLYGAFLHNLTYPCLELLVNWPMHNIAHETTRTKDKGCMAWALLYKSAVPRRSA